MSRPLELYLGEDNQIWALDKALGVGYRMPPSDQRNQHPPAPPSDSGAGIAEAPTDGKLYGRESAAWAVVPPAPPPGLPLTGGTLTGSVMVDASTADNDFAVTGSPNGQISVHGWYIRFTGPYSFSLSVDNTNGNLAVGFNGITIGLGGAVTTGLSMDQTTGDIIAKAIAGPNAGKSVNLTAGKWA